jgi:hypothetical protein
VKDSLPEVDVLRGPMPLRILFSALLLAFADNGAAQTSSSESDSQIPAYDSSLPAIDYSSSGSSKKKSIKKTDSSSALGNSSVMAKGEVKGIVEGRIRFDSRMFRNIAVGQVFIVESKTSGERAARVEVHQVSKNKRLTSAKILKLETGVEVKDLLGLTVYREKDFNALYSEVQLNTLIAPETLAGRNNSLNFHLNLLSVTPPAPNILTGVSLNQSITSLGPTIEFFIPSGEPQSVANRFGVHVQYLQSVPITIVGKVSGTDETQSLKLSTTDSKAALVFKMRASKDTLSQFWIAVGYQILESKLKLETNVNVGNTGVEFKQKGPEFSLGGDFSPLPFLYLGLDLNAGIPQKYTSTDSSSSAARSGNWTQIKTGVYGELRYPVGRSKSNVLSLQMKGGATIDQFENKKNSKTVKENVLNPLFAVRLGLHAG